MCAVRAVAAGCGVAVRGEVRSELREGTVDKTSRNEIKGRVFSAVQANEIHGDVHVHARPGAGRAYPSGELAGLAAAADALADAGYGQWARTVRDRGLVPAPIPVRWAWHRRLSGDDGGPFDPFPGVSQCGSDGGGTIDDLLGVIGGARSGRAVLLGDGGSGKSDAAAWTAFQALRVRRGLDEESRSRFPVPVLMTATDWDHRRAHLDDWLAAELEARYRFLRRRGHGRDVARRLLRDDRIVFLLDGLDEMPLEQRRAALDQIDHRAVFRVVVFSRVAEYDEVRAGRLTGAAELRLLPVDPPDAAAYFRRCQGDPAPEPWEWLITRLREEPDGFLARALD